MIYLLLTLSSLCSLGVCAFLLAKIRQLKNEITDLTVQLVLMNFVSEEPPLKHVYDTYDDLPH